MCSRSIGDAASPSSRLLYAPPNPEWSAVFMWTDIAPVRSHRYRCRPTRPPSHELSACPTYNTRRPLTRTACHGLGLGTLPWCVLVVINAPLAAKSHHLRSPVGTWPCLAGMFSSSIFVHT
ncbi:hypothetical protein C8Q76DRAFT_716707 [Earliella scabrosa]|nr:hypothetical protein C8Q76DRAFT_716707 [Earliella scabrosa]